MIQRRFHWGWSFALAGAIATLGLYAGCQSVQPPPDELVDTLDEAQALADPAAENWNTDARLIGITAVWVDENGALEEAPDGPGYGFQYVNSSGTQQIGITVETDGNVEVSDAIDLAAPVLDTLSAHTNHDIEEYIDAAQAELHELDIAVRPGGNGVVDIAVIIGFNGEDGSEDAVVLFHEEDDQGTNWDEFDWTLLFANADEYVFLDTATLEIETNSWEMSFERALRIATQANGEYNRLVGIIALWVNEDAELHEVADQPGWGFQFVNEAGDERISMTVDQDGAVITFDPETLETPQLSTLSPHEAEDLEEYVTVALAELATAPAEHRPTTETMDIVVLIGFSQTDNSEEVIVMFHDEEDQATDFASLDWFALFTTSESYVFLDTATNSVENISWD